MSTNEVDIFIEQGADWEFDFPIDPSIDLNAGSAIMMIKTHDGSTVIATLDSNANGLTINVSAQTIRGKLVNSKTSGFVPGKYKYDIKFQDANSIIYRTNQGHGTIDAQVTTGAPPSISGIPVTANGEQVTANGQTVTT